MKSKKELHQIINSFNCNLKDKKLPHFTERELEACVDDCFKLQEDGMKWEKNTFKCLWYIKRKAQGEVYHHNFFINLYLKIKNKIS